MTPIFISQLILTTNVEEFRTQIEASSNLLESAGCYRPLDVFVNKEQLIDDICHWLVLDRARPALERCSWSFSVVDWYALIIMLWTRPLLQYPHRKCDFILFFCGRTLSTHSSRRSTQVFQDPIYLVWGNIYFPGTGLKFYLFYWFITREIATIYL